MEVLSDVVWLSGREGYRSSSASCWDRRFGYGQRRRCGVPHLVISHNKWFRSWCPLPCGEESAIGRVRGTWTLCTAEEMVDTRPSTGGKGAVEETVNIKA